MVGRTQSPTSAVVCALPHNKPLELTRNSAFQLKVWKHFGIETWYQAQPWRRCCAQLSG